MHSDGVNWPGADTWVCPNGAQRPSAVEAETQPWAAVLHAVRRMRARRVTEAESHLSA